MQVITLAKYVSHCLIIFLQPGPHQGRFFFSHQDY
jgi:hypothetical protein